MQTTPRAFQHTRLIALILLVLSSLTGSAQHVSKPVDGPENMPPGTLPERAWWNLLHYDIRIAPDIRERSLAGTNAVTFRVIKPGQVLRIDLQEPMTVTDIRWKGSPLPFTRKEDAYLLFFPQELPGGREETITIQFEGHPKEAVKPPFGGSGWIWEKDKLDRPWVSLACEGEGASVWLPCKNVLYDEPDRGITFSITVPDTLVAVGNGRLQGKTQHNGTTTWHWVVSSPINHYNICPYIGRYVTWHHNYPGLRGNLDCDYWVIDYNAPRAKIHFREADTMLHCFEDWMGPYPFYKDSYKVVESPMTGMEHQSAIAYGNGFEKGYHRGNLSGTRWGFLWDFVLVHESGHEWFGNSLTASSHSDSWIHEGFTKYLEVLITEYYSGKEAGSEYAQGIWKRIKNDQPIVGSGSSDEYNKGCALLHMIRQISGDTVFRKMLHNLNALYYHQTISTSQVLSCMNRTSGLDFTKMFEQYLTTSQAPVLEYSTGSQGLQVRWTNCVAGFDMPVSVWIGGQAEPVLIRPSVQWKQLGRSAGAGNTLAADKNFWVETRRAALP